MGATGILVCLDLESGALVWRTDTLADSDAEPLPWGCASSPLVSDGRVYISSGQSSSNLLAYDAESGELLWKWRSPTRSLVAVEAADGTRDSVRDSLSAVQLQDPVGGGAHFGADREVSRDLLVLTVTATR